MRHIQQIADPADQVFFVGIGVAVGGGGRLVLLFGLRMNRASGADAGVRYIHALGGFPVQASARPGAQPKVIERPRLAGFLVEDIKAGRVAVEDAVDRSVVTIRGDELFASASSSIVDDYQPLMLRIADAIRRVKGQVRVTGHSDNRPIAPLRFPSNWALSEARAMSVMDILAAKTGQAERFSAEGRSDTEPVATNATAEGRARNRRVEITVLAEGVE